MRGIACVLLVLFHVIGHDSTHGLKLPADHALSIFNQTLAYFRMPMFAFLSGVVYAFRPFDGNYAEFMRGKFRRLIVPMLIVGTAVAVLTVMSPYSNTKTDWRHLHVIPVAHYWFLESMFLVFACVMMVDRPSLLRRHGVLIGTIAAAAAAAALHLGADIEYFGINGAVYLLPYFLVGVWFTRFGSEYKVWRYAVPAALCVGILGSLAYHLRVFPDKQSVVAFLASAMVCMLLLRSGLKSDAVAYIGRFSFSIYLFHTTFAGGARLALRALSGVPLWTMVVAGTVAGIVGSIVLEKLLRRSKWGRMAIGLRAKDSSSIVTDEGMLSKGNWASSR